jgi:threonine dehydratase
MKIIQSQVLDRLNKMIVRTPLLNGSGELNGQNFRRNLYFKDESIQALGSYKIRGVVNALNNFLEYSPHELTEISTVSAGNMAQAVALTASELGIAAKIFVPDSAPDIKKLAIRKFGAEVIERPFHEIWSMVRDGDKIPRQQDNGHLFIHPIVTPGLNCGYESIAEEILMDLTETDYLVIPFGVGGLSLGLARYMKRNQPDVKLILAEVETASPFFHSMKNGRASAIDRRPSFIDAIGTPECLSDVFEELRGLIYGVHVVSVSEALNALKKFHFNFGRLCEGAAAVAIAASEKIADVKPIANIVAIVSGGNISKDILTLTI